MHDQQSLAEHTAEWTYKTKFSRESCSLRRSQSTRMPSKNSLQPILFVLLFFCLTTASASEKQPKVNSVVNNNVTNITADADLNSTRDLSDSTHVYSNLHTFLLDGASSARKLFIDGASIIDLLISRVGRAETDVTLPMRIYECVRGYSLLRCMKLFLLQRVEEVEARNKPFVQTTSIQHDFADQFIVGSDNDHQPMGSLIRAEYVALSDAELNERLSGHFKRFFKHRQLHLRILPGMEVMVVPSVNDQLQFSVRKEPPKTTSQQEGSEGERSLKSKQIDGNLNGGDESSPKKGSSGGGGGGHTGGSGGGALKSKRKKGSLKKTMIQMAVPIMMLPAILMSSFLPFVLPMLKMATIMTLMMNNSAFLAALIYAARTHANAQEEQHISYGHHGIYK